MAALSNLPNRNMTYSFSSQPKVIWTKKFRDEDENIAKNLLINVMHDHRAAKQGKKVEHSRKKNHPFEKKMVEATKPRTVKEITDPNFLNSFCPNPLTGHLTQPVQTELYLEQLTETIEESDVQCQTDWFMCRPATPIYVPTKTGEDIGTQINEGDLFDFELEVTPMLEVLVGKTVEQALLEVKEEEELADIREQQFMFEQVRQAELAEVQRLQEQDRRITEEKERRKQQFAEAAVKAKDLRDKVTASVFTKAYLNDLVNSVLRKLADIGFFYDPVERDIEEGFVLWLMEEVERELNLEEQSKSILDLMIREIVDDEFEAYRQLEELNTQDVPVVIEELESKEEIDHPEQTKDADLDESETTEAPYRSEVEDTTAVEPTANEQEEHEKIGDEQSPDL